MKLWSVEQANEFRIIVISDLAMIDNDGASYVVNLVQVCKDEVTISS